MDVHRKVVRGLTVLLLLATMAPATPVAPEPLSGHLPVWEEGFSWSYLVDHDVEYDLGFIQVNHIRENWTRVVDQVLDVGGDRVYKVWESRSGTLRGTVTYGITFPVTATAGGTGWTLIRASDMAVINQTFDLTFSGTLPIGGSFSGGFDNTTTYDPPMPMLEFPVPSTSWHVASTVNTTTEFYITAPTTESTWYNTSELWDLNVTATGPSPFTVPAGTYDAFTVHEVGTRSNTTDSWPVDRRWYYADEATSIVRTFEGHDLVWTDAVYTPPNSPPEGPSSTVELSTDEDVPLDIDLAGHFSDPDGDPLTFDLSLEGPSGSNATLAGTGAVRTLSPGANWNGVLDLRATASDPFGQAATGVIVVTVASVNDPPHVVWQPHNLATEEDTPLRSAHDLADVFSDVDGDVLALSAASTPGVVAFMNGTAVDLYPEPDWTGVATVLLGAEDPHGENATTSFELMVGEVNDPPIIVSSGGPARIHEKEEGDFWVEAMDADSEDLEYTWTVEGGTVVGVEGPSFTYAPGDLPVRRVTVSVVVEDEWNARAEASWEVTILDSPVIVSRDPPSPVSVEVGDTVTFMVAVEDADTPDVHIRWTWNGDLVGSGEGLPMIFGDRDVGEGALRVEVDDGVGNDSAEWTVTVTVPNLPPTVAIRRDVDVDYVDIVEGLELHAEVTDEDVANLTIDWLVDGAHWSTGMTFSYEPSRSQVGEEIGFQVSVSDGEHTVTDFVTYVVTDSETSDPPGDPFPWGTVFAVALVLVIVAGILVALLLKRRPGRQG